MKKHSIYELIEKPETLVSKTIFTNRFVTKLTQLNRKSSSENINTVIVFLILNLVIGIAYFLICSTLFADMWYQKVIVSCSSIIFIYLNLERKLEKISDSLHQDLIDAIEKFLHHYHISRGSVLYALDKTIERCRKNIKPFLEDFQKAFTETEQRKSIEELKLEMPNNWLITFLEMISKGNLEGYRNSLDKDPISEELQSHLETLTKYMNNKLKQDAKLLNNQNFCFIVPIIVIPLALLINGNMVSSLDMANPYDNVTAKNISSLLLLIGNAGSLMIHWIRKIST